MHLPCLWFGGPGRAKKDVKYAGASQYVIEKTGIENPIRHPSQYIYENKSLKPKSRYVSEKTQCS
jgi:hypothetical protein